MRAYVSKLPKEHHVTWTGNKTYRPKRCLFFMIVTDHFRLSALPRKACSRLRDCRVREIEKVRTLCESLEQAKLSRLWLAPFVSIWIAHATEEARGVMGRRKRKGTWRQGTSWSNRPDEIAYFPSFKFHLSPPLIIRHLESGSGINCWLEKSLLAIFPSV